MTKAEAQQIIEDDADYDDDGNLKEGFAEEAAGDDQAAKGIKVDPSLFMSFRG